MQVRLKPDEWPCSLKACCPGPFVCRSADGSWSMGFKTDYSEKDGTPQVYCDSGETFCSDVEVWACTVVIDRDDE